MVEAPSMTAAPSKSSEPDVSSILRSLDTDSTKPRELKPLNAAGLILMSVPSWFMGGVVTGITASILVGAHVLPPVTVTAGIFSTGALVGAVSFVSFAVVTILAALLMVAVLRPTLIKNHPILLGLGLLATGVVGPVLLPMVASGLAAGGLVAAGLLPAVTVLTPQLLALGLSASIAGPLATALIVGPASFLTALAISAGVTVVMLILVISALLAILAVSACIKK